jgi:hypothetical protein
MIHLAEPVAEILAELEPHKAAIIRAAIAGAGAPPRLDPLDARDEAIRDALGLLYTGKASRRAKDLAKDLSDYLSNGWARERQLEELEPPASEPRRAWHKIVRLNSGRGLSWLQILHVGEGHRGRNF